ncbi:hypothetical protein D3C87_1821970 [compost metagenome]
MANANVDNKSDVETKSDEPRAAYDKRDSPWRKQPSVLKSRGFKIGDGEDDPVD